MQEPYNTAVVPQLPYKGVCVCEFSDRSTAINKARLRRMAAQEQVVTEVYVQSQKQLAAISSDTAKYKELLTNLIVQVGVSFHYKTYSGLFDCVRREPHACQSVECKFRACCACWSLKSSSDAVKWTGQSWKASYLLRHPNIAKFSAMRPDLRRPLSCPLTSSGATYRPRLLATAVYRPGKIARREC